MKSYRFRQTTAGPEATASKTAAMLSWGHTPAEWPVDYAVAARAKRLALTHHDPLRDDEAVDRVVEMCRRRASAAGSGLEVFAAAEMQELRFIERDAKTPAAAHAREPARKVGPHTILVADDDPTAVERDTLGGRNATRRRSRRAA